MAKETTEINDEIYNLLLEIFKQQCSKLCQYAFDSHSTNTAQQEQDLSSSSSMYLNLENINNNYDTKNSILNNQDIVYICSELSNWIYIPKTIPLPVPLHNGNNKKK